MKNKSLTDMMEAAMHNLQSSKMTRAAFAAVLVLGSASLAAADNAPAKPAAVVKPAAKTAGKLAVAAKKAEQKKIDPALAEIAAKEKVTREKNDKDARAAYLRGLELRDKEMKYEQAIAEFLKAKKIWEGQQGIEPAKYVRDVEEVKKHIYQAYYDWAKELALMAEKDAAANKMDDAIAKCRKAAEMYEPCKEIMAQAIAKYEQKKRAMEFASATATKVADPGMEERVENIELALQRGRAYYRIGRYDDARTQFNTVLVQDPYNGVAIDYLRKIYLKMNDVGKQRKKLFAAEAINEAVWKPITPILLPSAQDDDEIANTEAQTKTDSTKTLRSKLQQIKFKTLVFEDTPLDEVVKYLKRRSKENDEDKVGVNFVLRCNEGTASSGDEYNTESEEGGEGEEAASGEMPLITIYFGADEDDNGSAPEITLEKVIEAVCQSANLKYRVEDYAVVIATSDVSLEDYVTEFYTVEKEAIDAAGADDIKSYFESRGVKFDEGANALFDEQTNKLIVVNTPQMQERVQQLVATLNRSDPQIQVQVKFVEISMNDMEELGFEYTVSRSNLYGENGDALSKQMSDITGAIDPNWVKQGSETIEIDGRKRLVDRWVSTQRTWTNNTGVPVTIWSDKTTTVGDGLSSSTEKGYTGGGYTYDPKTTDNKITLNDGGTIFYQYTAPNSSTVVSGYTTEQIRQLYRDNGINFYSRMAPEYAKRLRHSVTFDKNERTVRSASSDPLAFGAGGDEGEVAVQDTVFNWTRYTSAGYTYNAKIHALDQADSADTLSSPRVTTMNSQTATIKMVEQVYYPESWGDSELNNVEGMLIFIPSTPEFGDPVEEGVQLEVTPEIADEEKYTLLMQMNPVILDFAGWTDYSYTIVPDPDEPGVLNTLIMPILEARAVQTNVVCYDRSTVVLGGIVKDKISSVDDQYPILGDIPIVGRLFQSKGKGSRKTNLLIFLTASLVNSDGSYFRDNVERGVPQF